MRQYVALVGLDEPEAQAIREQVDAWVIDHVTLPRMVTQGGQLWMEARGGQMVPVRAVVYHGIYEDDLDWMVGLALWGGPCLPRARAMMDCRLKLPCLVRALEHTRFGEQRGFASARARVETQGEQVAKWGNWHCGENKARINGSWTAEYASVLEPYFPGQAVRVLRIGDHVWQIRLEGEDWLKSIHHASAAFMEPDAELVADTRHLAEVFGLAIIANDYMVSPDGQKHLLEVNHIPNVTRFPEVWAVYRDFVAEWINQLEPVTARSG